MATYALNNFSFSFVVRRAPKSGPTSSDKWNDTMDEIAIDLAKIANEWNTKLVPTMAGLPDGSDDTSVNAFVNGLDGLNLWVDQDSSADSDDTRYYNSTKDRPNTVKEQFDNVYLTISNEIAELSGSGSGSSGGLTSTEKAAIGWNIFDSTLTSSATSLDGKSENNRLNIIQIATDMYGDEVALNNDGSTILDNSVKAMVNALLAIHDGSWSGDVTVNHSTITGITQTAVAQSALYDDTYDDTNVATNLQQDLNRLRNEIKDAKGTAGWATSNSALYVGGADSLEDLLVTTNGTGTKTATNPWGYHHDDIDDLGDVLDDIRDFVGQTDHTDNSPTYSSTNFVNNGNSLETAIGELDYYVGSGITSIESLRTFTGQFDYADSTPDYDSTNYIEQYAPLRTTIGQLDAALATVSGIFSTLNFLGLNDTPSDYAGYSEKFLRVSADETRVEFSIVDPLYDGDVVANSFVTSGTRTLIGKENVSVAATGCMLTHSGMYIQSQNGTWYLITVADDGSLTTTAM